MPTIAVEGRRRRLRPAERRAQCAGSLGSSTRSARFSRRLLGRLSRRVFCLYQHRNGARGFANERRTPRTSMRDFATPTHSQRIASRCPVERRFVVPGRWRHRNLVCDAGRFSVPLLARAGTISRTAAAAGRSVAWGDNSPRSARRGRHRVPLRGYQAQRIFNARGSNSNFARWLCRMSSRRSPTFRRRLRRATYTTATFVYDLLDRALAQSFVLADGSGPWRLVRRAVHRQSSVRRQPSALFFADPTVGTEDGVQGASAIHFAAGMGRHQSRVLRAPRGRDGMAARRLPARFF